MKKSKSEISPVDDFWGDNDSRKHGRRPYHKPMRFSCNSNEYRGFVANISLGGAYISIQEKLALGGRIKIAVKGRKFRQEFNITGWIIRISPEGIGTVGMLVNFSVSLIISRYTPGPPLSVREMVERLRIPRGSSKAHELSL